MNTTIETGIPAPPIRRHKKRVTDEMKALLPGQSVVVRPEVAMCLRDYGRRNGWEVTTAKVRDNGNEADKLIRVWRVE